MQPGDDDSEPEPLLSPTLPTLLLFECVLAYMSPAASNALIQWFVDYFALPDSQLTSPSGHAVVFLWACQRGCVHVSL